MSYQYQRELDFARKLARHAGALAAAFYVRANRRESKEGGEPVTRADKTINALIVDAVREQFPDHAFLAEESPPDEDRGGKPVWIIDPIDGTREFINGTGQFAIHIAWALEGTPVLGVVYQAACQRLYYGGPGYGAYLDEAGRVSKLEVSDVRDPAAMKMAVSRSHMSKRVRAMVEALGVAEHVPTGGVGIKTCLVANGQADVYLHPSAATSQWDSAAPDAILRAAGGIMSDLRGNPLYYGSDETHLTAGIAASNGVAHDHILSLVKPIVDDWLG